MNAISRSILMILRLDVFSFLQFKRHLSTELIPESQRATVSAPPPNVLQKTFENSGHLGFITSFFSPFLKFLLHEKNIPILF